MFPNFLIIGAQKAGTTSLLKYLSTHPEIYVPAEKEISCFYEDEDYNRQFESFPYHKHFSGWQGEKYAGNAPVNTLFFSRETAKKIRHLCPGMKMIAVLRNPIDRAYSAYWYFVRIGVEKKSFEEALEREMYVVEKGSFYERCNFTYISHGFYYNQLKEFYRHFSADSILILLYDDFKNNATDVLSKVCEFLFIENMFRSVVSHKKYNVSSKARIQIINNLIYGNSVLKNLYKRHVPAKLRYVARTHIVNLIKSLNLVSEDYPPMRPSTQEALRSIFLTANKKLEALIGVDLSDWK